MAPFRNHCVFRKREFGSDLRGKFYPNSLGGFESVTAQFAVCSVTAGSPSCVGPYSLSEEGQIYFNISGNILYVVSTVSPIEGSFTGNGTTASSMPPSQGFLFDCPLSTLNSCQPTALGGYWPVSITVDSQTQNYLFVPTFSGRVGVFLEHLQVLSLT